VLSLLDYKDQFGQGPSVAKDSVMAYFNEGGSNLYFSRIVGPAAEAATITLGGAEVTATSPGEWANGLEVESGAVGAPAPAGTVIVKVWDGTELVEQSTQLSTDAEAAGWQGEYVRLDGLPTAPSPKVALAGGVDDDVVNASTVDTALNVFTYQLGPGQVCAPGLFDPVVHTALIDHASKHHRVALLDPPNTAEKAELEAAVNEVQSLKESRYAAMFAPWVVYPGETSPTTTVVPYSAIQAGLIARVDAAGNPAVSAAGEKSVHVATLDLLAQFSDADHEDLNNEGVNLAKFVYGAIETYGYRTAAAGPETNWMFFGESRVVMAIAHECDVAAQSYVFDPIDGRGHLFSKLAKDLIGICSRYYDMDALYGATAADAFRVEVANVNTVKTAQRGEVVAVVRVKTSKVAEWVDIPITKVPLDRAV
jgi:phage tail sheath protein FI